MLRDVLREQVSGRVKAEVEELILDGWNCAEISLSDKSLLEEFAGLEFLSMNNCGLTSLKNFPRLPNLIKLDLVDNKITTGLQYLASLPSLMQLGLSRNRIKAFSEVDFLVKLSKLLEVTFEGCPVTQEEKYRAHVFEKLTSVTVLDGTDAAGNIVDDIDEESDEEDDEELNQIIDEEEEEFDSDDIDSDSEDEAIYFKKSGKRAKPDVSDSEESDSEEEAPVKKRK